MYVKYGSYQHAAAEAAIVVEKEPIRNERGKIEYTRERWTVTGEIQAASQAALTTALDALEAAYATDGQDIGLYLDSGAESTHVLKSSDTIGGTRCGKIIYPQGRGAEYTTFRSYQVSVEGDFEAASPEALLSWEENITWMGGGPRFAFLGVLNGLPQKQLVNQATPFKAIQEGRASGRITWPAVSSPLWPAAEHIDQRRVTRRTPIKIGTSWRKYEVTWAYAFESAVPLIGNPRVF